VSPVDVCGSTREKLLCKRNIAPTTICARPTVVAEAKAASVVVVNAVATASPEITPANSKNSFRRPMPARRC